MLADPHFQKIDQNLNLSRETKLDKSEAKRYSDRMAELDFLKKSLELLDIALYVKSEAGKYLYLNKSAGKILNSDSTAILGVDDFSLFTKVSAHAIRLRDAAIVHGRKVYAYQTSSALKGIASTTNFCTVKYPIFDSFARSRGLLGLSFVQGSNRCNPNERSDLIDCLVRFRAEQLLRLCGESAELVSV